MLQQYSRVAQCESYLHGFPIQEVAHLPVPLARSQQVSLVAQ